MRRAVAARPDAAGLTLVLGLTLIALVWFGRGTLPIFDDWIFWTADVSYSSERLLEHYNGHASPVVWIVWNVVTQVTGGHEYVWHRLIFIGIHLASLALFYYVVAPRVGRGIAFAFLVPLTLMGHAWLDYVMPISGIYQAVGCLGLVGAIVALERGTRRGDVAACLALVAVTFSAVAGMAAVAGIFVWLLWPQPRPQWRRLWVAVVPIALFLAWYPIYSPEEGGATLQPSQDAGIIPGYIADGFSHGIRTYTVLGQDWSVALAAFLVVLLVRQGMRPGGFDRTLAAAVAGGVAYWAVVAIGRGPELRVDQLRYLYANAFHVVLIAALALGAAGLRSNRRSVIACGVVAFALFLPSAQGLRAAYTDEREESDLARAAITGVELGVDRAPGDYNPIYAYRPDDGFLVSRYKEAIEQGRTLGWPEKELPDRPMRERAIVDESLLGALRPEVAPAPAPLRPCRAITGEIRMKPGATVVLRNLGAGEGAIVARRFGIEPKPAGTLPPNATSSFTIPTDRAKTRAPWSVTLRGDGPFRACF